MSLSKYRSEPPLPVTEHCFLKECVTVHLDFLFANTGTHTYQHQTPGHSIQDTLGAQPQNSGSIVAPTRNSCQCFLKAACCFQSDSSQQDPEVQSLWNFPVTYKLQMTDWGFQPWPFDFPTANYNFS